MAILLHPDSKRRYAARKHTAVAGEQSGLQGLWVHPDERLYFFATQTDISPEQWMLQDEHLLHSFSHTHTHKHVHVRIHSAHKHMY